jgi:Uma2 family endonuclease
MTDPAKVKRATVQDLLAIPEEYRRHEIIDGVLVEKEAASGKHGRAQLRVARRLGPFERRPGGRWPGGWWFATEVEILLAETEVFRPDVSGWRLERLASPPDDIPIPVRPDWICEILSTNRRNDLIKKKRAYHRHGVGHYWIIDPLEQTLVVHRWSSDGYVDVLSADASERVRAEPFEAIELRIGALFDDFDDED